ncbi:hypothetical protein M3627_00220 [Psychrobacillus sp. MER TA 171]|nr:hypothetical protein [Psychrobacillus sp. MER TA 171]
MYINTYEFVSSDIIVAYLSNKKSAIACLCLDRQMEKSEEAALQPPLLLSI